MNLIKNIKYRYKYCTNSPLIIHSNDGEFGQTTGWLLKAPYLRYRYFFFGPRETAVCDQVGRCAMTYVKAVTGWRKWIVTHFGNQMVQTDCFEIWNFNWTAYRVDLEEPTK